MLLIYLKNSAQGQIFNFHTSRYTSIAVSIVLILIFKNIGLFTFTIPPIFSVNIAGGSIILTKVTHGFVSASSDKKICEVSFTFQSNSKLCQKICRSLGGFGEEVKNRLNTIFSILLWRRFLKLQNIGGAT